jgi:hypothetical protein
MRAPHERHQALVVYCCNHICKDCPMNDPQLGCIDDEDPCVVTLAMDVLRPELKVKS